jgi:hypothetical protein
MLSEASLLQPASHSVAQTPTIAARFLLVMGRPLRGKGPAARMRRYDPACWSGVCASALETGTTACGIVTRVRG